MKRFCHRLSTSLLCGMLFIVWGQRGRAAESEVKPTSMPPQTSEPQQALSGVTPLHQAVAQGNLEQVRLLLSQGADVQATAHADSTPLLWAAARGHTAIVRLLLEHGAAVATPSSSQRTPLHWAALQGHEATARALLAAQAPVDVGDARGHTPLHLAAIAGHTPLARLLLDSGAPLDASDTLGYTPLYWAVVKGHTELTGLLLARGADPQVSGVRGESLLVLARRKGYGAIVALLALPEATEPPPEVPSTSEPSTLSSSPIVVEAVPAVQSGDVLPALAVTPAVKTVSLDTPAPPSSPESPPAAQVMATPSEPTRRVRSPVTVVDKAPPKTSDSIEGDFVVQLAALSSTSLAQQLWSRQQQAFPALLGQRPLMLEEVDLGERGVLYRVRTGPFASRDEATAFCAHFHAQQQDCWVVPRLLQASGNRKP